MQTPQITSNSQKKYTNKALMSNSISVYPDTVRELQNVFVCQYVASNWLMLIYSETPYNSQTVKILI